MAERVLRVIRRAGLTVWIAVSLWAAVLVTGFTGSWWMQFGYMMAALGYAIGLLAGRRRRS